MLTFRYYGYDVVYHPEPQKDVYTVDILDSTGKTVHKSTARVLDLERRLEEMSIYYLRGYAELLFLESSHFRQAVLDYHFTKPQQVTQFATYEHPRVVGNYIVQVRTGDRFTGSVVVAKVTSGDLKDAYFCTFVPETNYTVLDVDYLTFQYQLDLRSSWLTHNGLFWISCTDYDEEEAVKEFFSVNRLQGYIVPSSASECGILMEASQCQK